MNISKQTIINELQKIDSRFTIRNNLIIGKDLGLKEIPPILLNIKGYEIDLSYNNISSIDGLIQHDEIDLSSNNITSLNGFKQNGDLYLHNNNISFIHNFFQNGFLDLGKNNIKEIGGLIHNGSLDLRGNPLYSTKNIEFNKKFSMLLPENVIVYSYQKDLIKYLNKIKVKYSIVSEKYQDL